MRKVGTMRIIAISVGLLALATTTGVVRADRKKHEEKYCTSLSAVSADLAKLEALGPDSTIAELRAAVAQLDTHGKSVDKEARKIRTDTSKRFVQSVERLSSEMQALPDTMTIGEARTRISDDVRAVKRSAQQLAEESGCPEALPKESDASGSATPQPPT